jgi:hypothetical protein
VVTGDGGCEAYTAIAQGVGLSHESSDIAGAESFYSLESNMCGTATRGADWPNALDLSRPIRRGLDDVRPPSPRKRAPAASRRRARRLGSCRMRGIFRCHRPKSKPNVRRNRALNCCVGAVIDPFAVRRNPFASRNRCRVADYGLRAFARRTQKPFSALWNVARSTRPASTSWVDDSGCGFIRSVAFCGESCGGYLLATSPGLTCRR